MALGQRPTGRQVEGPALRTDVDASAHGLDRDPTLGPMFRDPFLRAERRQHDAQRGAHGRR